MNIKTEVWSPASPILHSVFDPFIAATGMHIYVILCNDDENGDAYDAYGASVQCYDTVTEARSFRLAVTENMGSTYGASAVTLGDCIYLVGGFDKLCAEYNIHTDTWRSLESCLQVRIFGSTAVFGGKIVLLGGGTNAEDLGRTETDSVECYDVDKNEWRDMELKLPVSMCGGHYAIVVNVAT